MSQTKLLSFSVWQLQISFIALLYSNGCGNETADLPNTKGSITLLRSKERNKATAVTTKLQRSNALICFTEHTLKLIENKAPLRYAKV